MTLMRTASFGLLAVAGLLSFRSSWAQQPAAPLAIPAQILAAKKVFIYNGGVDSASSGVSERAVGPNDPYNRFFLAMKAWGRYEIVGTPADADLVLELRFTAPLSSCQTYQPLLALAILDTKTHFRLWTLTKPVGDARRRAAWDKNLKEGIDNLVDDLRQLATGPAFASR